MMMEDAADPNTDEYHIVEYRYKSGGSGTINLTVRLKQGTTTIASWQHNSIGPSWVDAYQTLTWVDAYQTLTSQEANSITDYTDLRIEFEAAVP